MNKKLLNRAAAAAMSLCLALSFFFVIGRPAYASSGGATFFAQGLSGQVVNEYIRSVADNDKGIFVLTNQRLCRYEQEANNMETLSDDLLLQNQITLLISADSGLWAVNTETNSIMKYSDNGFVSHSNIPWDTLDDDREETPSILSAVIQNGVLYMVVPSLGSNDYAATEVVGLDLQTAIWKKTTVQNFRSIAKYKAGKLLAFSQSDADTSITLQIYDIASDSTLVLASLPYDTAGAPAYDKEHDRILYTEHGECKAIHEGGESEIVGYMPLAYVGSESQGYALPGQQYVVYASDGLYIRDADKALMQNSPLRIAGWDASFVQAFNVANPNSPAILNQKTFDDAASYVNAIMTGSDDVDVFEMHVTGGIDSLITKGFADDLSASPLLLKDAATMYPQIQSVISKDGKLFAVPVDFNVDVWQYSPQSWDSMQLGSLPNSMQGFLEAYKDWEANKADSYPEISFARGKEDEYSWLLQTIISQYLLEVSMADEPPTLNTPAFRATMAAFEKLDKRPIDLIAQSNSEIEELDEIMDRDAILRLIPLDIYDLFTGSYDHLPNGTIMSIPTILENTSPMVRFSMNVYMINPNSANKEAALKFLEFVAQNRELSADYATKPSLNDPIEDPYFSITQAELTRQISEQKERLKACKPSETQQIEEDIKAFEEQLANADAYRWKISTSTIAPYRTLAEHLFMPRTPLYASGVDPIQLLQDIISRYSSKQINLDQFIDEMDKKIRMIYLEGQ